MLHGDSINKLEEKKFEPDLPSQAIVEKIDLFDIPHTIDFNDIGDKETGNLISKEGCKLLDTITFDQPPGRYSKFQIREMLIKENPNLTEQKLNQIFPYIPGVTIDYHYNIRATPLRPDFELNPSELYIFTEKELFKYLVIDHHQTVHEGILQKGEADDTLNSQLYSDLSTLLADISEDYIDDLEEITEMKEANSVIEQKRIDTLKRGTIWYIFDDHFKYRLLFTAILNIAYLRKHIDLSPSVHAIYKGGGNRLGRGGFGKAKVAFDIHLRKYDVVKVQLDEKSFSNPKECIREQENIYDLGYGSGHLVGRIKIHEKSRELVPQYNLVMKYIKGIQLDEFLRTHRELTFFRLIHIALKITNKMNAIHMMNYLHGDIKLGNLLYNSVTEEIDFVDWAFAMPLKPPATYQVAVLPDVPYELSPFTIYIKSTQECLIYEVIDPKKNIIHDSINWGELPPDFPRDQDEIIKDTTLIPIILWQTSKKQHTFKEAVAYAGFKGTRSYIAPEIIDKHDENKSKKQRVQLEYSKVTEIYSLGVLLKRVLGMTFLGDKEPHLFCTTNLLLHSNTKLEKIIKKMTAHDPNERPMLSEVIAELNYVYHSLIPVCPKIIALLNVNDYATATEKEKKIFQMALKSTDIVLLFDAPTAQRSRFEMSAIRRELIVAGIFVENYVYTTSDPDQIPSQYKLDHASNSQQVISIENYCLFHSASLVIKPVTNIDCIDISKHTADFYTELRSRTSFVTSEHLNLIKAMLQSNIDRLNKKKSNAKIKMKIEEFQSHIAMIESYHNKKITYIKLFSDLHKWERKILHERLAFVNFLLKPKTRLTSIQAIETTMGHELASQHRKSLTLSR